jgi:type I restriction enzyme R subunit
MTEFKQIIGRGTRINEDYGKLFFTIMDYKRATVPFADPDFDDDPVQIYEPKEGETVVSPDDVAWPPNGSILQETSPTHFGDTGDGFEPGDFGETGGERPARYYVDNVEVRVATERVQYLDESGRLITESLTDYSRKTVQQSFASLGDFLTVWNDAERKQVILDELAAKGVFLDELAEQVGRDFDAFDLICHVAYDQPPLTRKERANKVQKRNVFARHSDKARAVLEALLQKYTDNGIKSVESLEILKVDPLTQFGTPMEIMKLFGTKAKYLSAIRELEDALYLEVA